MMAVRELNLVILKKVQEKYTIILRYQKIIDILIVYLGRELNKDDSNINALTELEVLGGSEEKNVEFSGGAEGSLELVTVNRL